MRDVKDTWKRLFNIRMQLCALVFKSCNCQDFHFNRKGKLYFFL